MWVADDLCDKISTNQFILVFKKKTRIFEAYFIYLHLFRKIPLANSIFDDEN